MPIAPWCSISRTAAPFGADTFRGRTTRCGRTLRSGSPGCPSARWSCLPPPTARSPPLAAADLEGDVRVLDGGADAWNAAGFELAAGEEGLAPNVNDVWLRPYDRGAGIEDAMRQYLAWEVDLVAQIERDGTARFGPFRDSA